MNDWDNDINKSIEVLEQGGVILFPTDTIWGLGCDATDPVAVEKILRIKQRSSSQGFIVLLDDETRIAEYVTNPDSRIFDYLKTTLKPTTVIYEDGKNVAYNILPGNGSLAIRLVKDAFCNKLIAHFGKPIVSTSANLHGSPSPSIFREVDIKIKDAVDFIVRYGQQETTAKEASAVVKWLAEGKVEIIRP